MKKFYIHLPIETDGSEGMIKEGCLQIHYHDLVFDVFVDGEVYNEDHVQEELCAAGFPQAKYKEELFLYAYLLWGTGAMEHMEGAFSFAVLQDNSLFVAKDPLGLRPIYYQKDAGTVRISNRISTLLEYDEKPAVLDKNGILELFTFGPSISEDKTLLKGMYALPMGSYLQVRNHEIHTEVYYHLHAKPHTDSLEETVQKVHDLLTDSIRAQLKGCCASFLSGGLDSSIITSVAAKEQKDWRTYSLDYEGNKENFKGNMYQVSLDNQFIDEMIDACGCDHSSLVITQQELLNRLTKAMKARDCPGMADVDSSLLWLCEHVAEHERIILSGECSDEIFGGYPWFYREELKDLDTFPWLRSSDERISMLNEQIRDLDYEGYRKQQYENSLREVEMLDSDSEQDKRARIHTLLCLHWFMQTLVTRQVCEGDMANLNIRAPFANVKLLEYVYNIPWDLKFLDQEEKGILRKAFEKELPASVAHRKKNPFPKTHNPLYAELISRKLQERYDDPNSPLHVLLDDAKLKELINSRGESYQLPWYGQLMSGPQLLAYLYQIDQWILTYDIQIDLS